MNTEHFCCELALNEDGNPEYNILSQDRDPYIKWKKDTITYALIRGTDDIPGDALERQAFNLAMTTWDLEIPNKLVAVKANENPDIRLFFQTGEENEYFRLNPSTLALTYLPLGINTDGKIQFNDDINWVVTGGTEPVSYNLLSTMIHEIGHSLGLFHSDGIDHMMFPIYNNLLDLHQHDIDEIVLKYGAREYSSPTAYQRLKVWLRKRVRTIGT